jgi:RNA polymerase primary sigma factor
MSGVTRGNVAPAKSVARSARRRPLLARGAERRLAEKSRAGDRRARRELVERNLGLVAAVAGGHAGRGLPFEDLFQEGCLGLIRAAEGFDPALGHRFSTYATWWIRQAVGRALANQSRAIRLPVHLREKLSELGGAEAELSHALGRDPTEGELALRLGWPPGRLRSVLRARPDATSLDRPGSLLADAHEPDVPEAVARVLEAERLRRALGDLYVLERRVLVLRYGLDGCPAVTLAEAARLTGVSREWVRQLQRRAEKKLGRTLGVAG